MTVEVVRREVVRVVGVHARVVRVLEIDVARDVAVLVLVAEAGHRRRLAAGRRAGRAAAVAAVRLAFALLRAVLSVLLHALVFRPPVLEPYFDLLVGKRQR